MHHRHGKWPTGSQLVVSECLVFIGEIHDSGLKQNIEGATQKDVICWVLNNVDLKVK